MDRINYAPKWKTVNGELRLCVQDTLNISGNRKEFSEAEKKEIKDLIKKHGHISWDRLANETTHIGRLKLSAIIDHMLNTGEVAEPMMGFLMVVG